MKDIIESLRVKLHCDRRYASKVAGAIEMISGVTSVSVTPDTHILGQIDVSENGYSDVLEVEVALNAFSARGQWRIVAEWIGDT